MAKKSCATLELAAAIKTFPGARFSTTTPVNNSYRVSLRPKRLLPVRNTSPTERQSPELLSSGRGLHTFGCLFNKIGHSSWLRYVDGVTSLDLNDRSTRVLGHGTLGVRRNHSVLGGNEVPARLAPPRGFADLAANGSRAPRNLGVSHKRGLFRVYVGCER